MEPSQYFASCSLTEDEIENVGDYPTIFLTPDSDMWDPYDESYKSNEDSFLDSRGNISIHSIPVQHTLVADADMSQLVLGLTIMTWQYLQLRKSIILGYQQLI